MKITITTLFVLGLLVTFSPSAVHAASSESSGNHNSWTDGVPPAKDYNWNYSWSNYFKLKEEDGQAYKNMNQFSNAPAPQKLQLKKQEVVGPKERPEDRPKRAGQVEKPASVQEMVQQFQQDRQMLMKQLKECSDEQRQEILQQMEQLRSRMKEQVASLREQAHQQAEHMRTRFRNNRDRVLNQGGSANGGNGNNGNGGADR